MKKLIIIVVLLGVLGGGGFFGYTHFMGKKEAAVGEKPKEVAEAEKPKPLPPVYKYVKIPAINVSVIRHGTVIRLYSAAITLEVGDEKAEQTIKDYLPQLSDAFFSYLHAVSSLPNLPDISNARFVKERLKLVGTGIVGKGVIHDVLIQSTFDRRV
jgi:flagellar basal body-associated protein FliL